MSIMRHYIIVDNKYEEITHEEYLSLFGEGKNKLYATKLYREEITIDDVPEENRETVQAIVDARITKFGAYKDQPISSFELKKMIEEIV